MADSSKPKKKKKAVKSVKHVKAAVASGTGEPVVEVAEFVSIKKDRIDPRRRIRRVEMRMGKLRREAAANKRADAARLRFLKLLTQVKSYFAELEVHQLADSR
jgi:hypothetical protein